MGYAGRMRQSWPCTRPRVVSVAMWAAMVSLALAAQVAVPFEILTTHLPEPRKGEAYKVQLQASGGQAPYTWKLLQGSLPEGLRMDASGVIAGRAESSHGFALLVEVRDAEHPPLVETRLLPTAAEAPIALRWAEAPSAGASGENSGGQVSGAVQADYNGDDPAKLTVFAVAVNQDGKAFSLRYDQRQVHHGETTGALAFDVFLPPGHYRVQVDGVAEVRSGVVYRARLAQAELDVQ